MDPIINRKIRVAILGCGRISKNHFESLKEHQNNMELISICDTRQTILSSQEKKYNVKGYLNLDDMVKEEDLDLVVICAFILSNQFMKYFLFNSTTFTHFV